MSNIWPSNEENANRETKLKPTTLQRIQELVSMLNFHNFHHFYGIYYSFIFDTFSLIPYSETFIFIYLWLWGMRTPQLFVVVFWMALKTITLWKWDGGSRHICWKPYISSFLKSFDNFFSWGTFHEETVSYKGELHF